MADLTAFIAAKRREYQDQIKLCEGALFALDEIEKALAIPATLTLDGLKQAAGAAEIEEPRPMPV